MPLDDFILSLILLSGRYHSLRHFIHATCLFHIITLLISEVEICYGPINGNFLRRESLLQLGLLPYLLRTHTLHLLASVRVNVAPLLVELLSNFDLEFAQFDVVDIVHQLVERIILRLKLEEARFEARRVIRRDQRRCQHILLGLIGSA